MELFRQPNIGNAGVFCQKLNSSNKSGDSDRSLSINSAPPRLDEGQSESENTDQDQSKKTGKLPPINVFFIPHHNRRLYRSESDNPTILCEPVAVPQHLLNQKKTIVVLPPPISPSPSSMMERQRFQLQEEDQLQLNPKRQASSKEGNEDAFLSALKKAKM